LVGAKEANVRRQRDVTVLIVDDSRVFREAVTAFLSELDGVVVVGSAETGEEAEEVERRLRPHVVLMDIHMRGIGGLEATRRLKCLAEPPCVVVVTTFDADSLRRAAYAAGADAYLLKAQIGEELEAALRSDCSARGDGTAGAPTSRGPGEAT
jgi:DNA-binding NarL/FixJ family response regulator